MTMLILDKVKFKPASIKTALGELFMKVIILMSLYVENDIKIDTALNEEI